ncbi:MAG: hypothetical protein ABI467_16995 [Kofleriaceae bacterium]
MSHSLYLLAISCAGLAGACSGDDCGSPGSAEYGLVVSSDEVMLSFGDLVAGANNDCPASDAPSGVVSLTISGTQMPGSQGSGAAGLVTFCIPRPDQLGGDQPLGSAVKIVDLSGMDATCSYTLDHNHLPTGSAHGTGVCGNGIDKAGFGLVFDGFLGLTRTCGTTVDSVSVGLTGDVAVKPQ